jgi:hypothetical protein
MGIGKLKIFFDDRDNRLLDIVNHVLDRKESFCHLNDLLYPHLHPHGIKELAEPRGLRIAYAIIHLLGSLDSAKADERLNALRSLMDEVLNSADSHMRRNTARVLLQIMKELVRTRGDRLRQLELAHDFLSAVSGKPRIIRKLLREHHLLEMPEEWNQIAFDAHVHDSYTKGRKSPSHLIMDAWIKGVRYLTIIYYNYVDPEPVGELLEAAEILNISVRVGVEFPSRFHNKFIQLIWAPRGFSDAQDFKSFLRQPEVEEFMEEGRKVSEYQQEQVLTILEEFNEEHRLTINEEFGLEVDPLDRSEFLLSVKTGQASILHLARFIHACLLPAMEARVAHLREACGSAAPSERKAISRLVAEMNAFDSEAIVERFLRSKCHPDAPCTSQDRADLPDLLQLSPDGLIARLNQLHSGFRITLNLSKLECEDVLELVYDCKGAITHLEIFNLKDHTKGKAPDYQKINELQQVINARNVLRLTRIIREILSQMKSNRQVYPAERIQKYEAILKNAKNLVAYYEHIPLGSSLGSDSTGHSRRSYGMGFVIKETLPNRAGRKIGRSQRSSYLTIPVNIAACLQTTFIPKTGATWRMCSRILQMFVRLPALNKKIKEWKVENPLIQRSYGNIVALGGIRKECNGFHLVQPARRTRPNLFFAWRYLNGILKNTLKILAGLVPSMLTFTYTQDWWFLIYLGTPIWFAVTGLRNVLQSVFAGSGIRRSSLLKWNSYVNWDRMSDSLLYTGLSVPLLEYVIKVMLLEQTLGITTTTNPLMLYSVMSIVNGAYISGHNIIRGLPREAIVGNFFRSILNIPLSIGFNSSIGAILGASGVVAVNDILQQWASIISKSSSDCVAGIIEGVADRRNYIRIRAQDYRAKIAELFTTYEKLEIIFPESNVLQMLESNNFPNQGTNSTLADLQKSQIVNSLDLLYFWMYQPRARTTCISYLKKMTHEELQIFIRSQAVLCGKSEIARLFVDGLVGENWPKPLAFYLSNHNAYLHSLENIYESLYIPISILKKLALAVTKSISLIMFKCKEKQHGTLIPRHN